MSDARFGRCLTFTLREEGGVSNDPADRGKLTNRGVTQETFEFAIRHGLVRAASVRDLTDEDVKAIYHALYWIPSRAAELPAPLDLCLFDAYVNHRPKVAVRFIQAALKVDQDGVIGPKTIEAALEVPSMLTAVERYAYWREQFYRRLVDSDESQAKFLRGWLNRVAHVKAAALAEVA